MTQSALLSSGFELAPFVTSSGLLLRSWDAISSRDEAARSNMGVRLSWKVHKDNDLTIIAFETAPFSILQQDLVPSSALWEKNLHDFDFLCSKKSPLFSVNRAALDLFYANHQMLLDELKSQITSSTPLVVTGRALGGSIAVLFTLLLSDSIDKSHDLSQKAEKGIDSGKKGTDSGKKGIDLGKNRLLCITFGSPLIGDRQLQQAISHGSTWNSCFLHVGSHKDPLPRLLIKNHTSAAGMGPQTTDYMPFGMYLFCCDANSACFENPDSILELLKAMALIHDHDQGFQSAEYGNIVRSLHRKAICKDLTGREQDMTGYSSLHASISLQLLALGLTPHMQIWQQQQQQNTALVTTMETLEQKFIFQKGTKYEKTRKLNDSKIYMAHLEWYKKVCKTENRGYYDSYKNEATPRDIYVVNFHRSLKQHWEELVEEAETKPQKKDAPLRTRWLYGGTNYRRMVEPLDIAEYYRKGCKDYVNRGRSRHYIMLEELSRKEETAATSGSSSTNTKDVESILTFDSCFWAHVEEALLSCELVKDKQSSVAQKEEAKHNLLKFENYVYRLLQNYEVSSEIFLKYSSYMSWWGKYKEIIGTTNNSKLASFMSNADNYNVRYVRGTYDFS